MKKIEEKYQHTEFQDIIGKYVWKKSRESFFSIFCLLASIFIVYMTNVNNDVAIFITVLLGVIFVEWFSFIVRGFKGTFGEEESERKNLMEFNES